MNRGSGLDACYDAFERLKAGKPRLDKFVGIAPEKITPSVVSQEAGFDSGYLKKKRPNHQGIISSIEFYRSQSKSTTLSKAEAIKREKQKVINYKDRLEIAESLLEQSLARELLLASRIRELEDMLYNANMMKRIN